MKRIGFGIPSLRGKNTKCMEEELTLLKQPDASILRISRLEDSIHTKGLAPSDKSRQLKSKVVHYGFIHIREYERIAGDNPCVRRGVPLGLGWYYNQLNDVSVDAYEKNRRRRRTKSELLMSAADRYELLVVDWERSPREMASAVRNARKSKDQRRTTIVVNEFEHRMNLHRMNEIFSGLFRRIRGRSSYNNDDPFSQTPKDHMSQISKRSVSFRSRRSSSSSELDVTRHRGTISLVLPPLDKIGSEEERKNSGLSHLKLYQLEQSEEENSSKISTIDIEDDNTTVSTSVTANARQFSDEISTIAQQSSDELTSP